jgi:hypothetical protein
MTQAVSHLLEKVDQLSADERAELADLLVVRMTHNIPQDIEETQVAEVRRRIAGIESGAVALIDGADALARVRQIVGSA